MDDWAANWSAAGIALVIGAVGGFITVITGSVVSLVGLWRLSTKVDETNVKIDGMLVERDKANVKVGEAKEKIVGEEKAATLAEGQRQGREQTGGVPAAASGDTPLPVADGRTAVAAERSATATERVATATEGKK